MSTLEDITNRVDTLLHGYSLNTESTTWLTSSATTSSTTLLVHDATVISRGFIQVDDEIMYVHSTNNVDNTVTLSPWGRGARGSAVVSHAQNAKVVVAPVFPRSEIKKAINNTLDAMYPQAFGVAYTTFSYVAARTTYDIPDAAEQILNITHQTIGPSREWLPVRSWQIDRAADAATWGTGGNLGKTISVYSPIVPGRTVNVVYAKRPTLFDLTTSNTQDFATVTGLPSYSEDVVVYGAAFRMISFLDPSRLGPLSAEADVLDNQRGARSGENAARFLFNVYNTRLNEVADNLRRQYPIRSHHQR